MISGRGVCAGSVGPSIFSTRPDVPGRPATDQQMRMYMKLRCHHSQHIAAAKAGFSERTGRRIEGDPRLPSQKNAERPLRRKVADPLRGVWESDILPLLVTRPGMRPVMVLDEMQRRHPERDWDRLRRTLERRYSVTIHRKSIRVIPLSGDPRSTASCLSARRGPSTRIV